MDDLIAHIDSDEVMRVHGSGYNNMINTLYKFIKRLAELSGGKLIFTDDYYQLCDLNNNDLGRSPLNHLSIVSELEAFQQIVERDKLVSKYLSIETQSEHKSIYVLKPE